MEEHLTLLDRAIIFAAKAHAGAMRRDGHTPYILHCTEAAAIAATLTLDPEVLAAAVLHDVVEDTAVTQEALETQDLAVRQLTLADKLSNLRGIARDYEKYGDDLWEFFHQKSRAKQSWYYYRLETALSPLADTDAYREFHRLRLRVFEHGEAF